MTKETQRTIQKLERIIVQKREQMDDLDSTYNQCKCCGLKKYTNRRESLVKVDLSREIRKLEQIIDSMQKYSGNNEDEEE